MQAGTAGGTRSPSAPLHLEHGSRPGLEHFGKGDQYKITGKSVLGGMWDPGEERVRETLFQPEGEMGGNSEEGVEGGVWKRSPRRSPGAVDPPPPHNSPSLKPNAVRVRCPQT